MSVAIPWRAFSEVYGFMGNSFLKPMTQTLPVGLDLAFWEEFPDFGDDAVRKCIEACSHYADVMASLSHDEAVQRAAVEYTHLFVGPPSPAAPPWETLYRHERVTVGFGEATFDMRQLLREAGLEISNENRQYEDHMGIELLYLSVQCGRLADGGGGGAAEAVGAFVDNHPQRWIGAFKARVAEACPHGYFNGLTALAESVLSAHARMLSEGIA